MANVTISLSDSDKENFSKFCDSVGLSISAAMNVFVKKTLQIGKIPFSIGTDEEKPNRATIKAMKEGEKLIQKIREGKIKPYDDIEKMWEDLDKWNIQPIIQVDSKKNISLQKRGLNIDLLKDVVKILVDGQVLPEIYKDHELTGNWIGHRECHIQNDWLLIYKKIEDILVLELTRTGTHSDLFNK